MSTVKSKIIRGLAGDGAAGFDNNGVLWQTADITTASDNVGGNGWYRPDGQDRVWTNCYSSREAGVTYTNDTGRDIEVHVFVFPPSSAAWQGQLNAGGTALSTVRRQAPTYGGIAGNSDIYTLSGTVKNGETYYVDGKSKINDWMEYR